MLSAYFSLSRSRTLIPCLSHSALTSLSNRKDGEHGPLSLFRLQEQIIYDNLSDGGERGHPRYGIRGPVGWIDILIRFDGTNVAITVSKSRIDNENSFLSSLSLLKISPVPHRAQ